MKNTLSVLSLVLLASFSVFAQAPTITSFTPEEGGAGTEVTITGTNLINTTSVTFGGVAADGINVQSNTTVIATVGAGASGDVEVITASFGNATKSGFTFYEAPNVALLIPTTATEGETVRIRGDDLLGATAVSFGGVPATSFVIIDENEIQAVVANGASGAVQVTTPGGTDSFGGFTYDASPVITAFDPTSGAPGDMIVITGVRFTGATDVLFAALPAASFEIISDTEIHAVIGRILSTTGSIEIETPEGSDLLNGFTFINVPIVESFEPTSAMEGTTVTITGQRFRDDIESVSFGGVEAESFEVISDTEIRAVVGAGASGLVEVTNDKFGPGSLAGFTFLPPPSITSFTPASGKLGTVITITGEDFDYVTSVTVGGGEPIDFTIDSPTQITAVLTDAGSNRDIVLNSPYGNTFKSTFDFLSGVVIEDLSPLSGPVESEVTITGSGFSTVAEENIVLFGAVRGDVTAASATELKVKVPRGASNEPVTVTVGNMSARATRLFRVTFPGADITSESFSEATWDVGMDYATAIADINGDGKPDLLLKKSHGIFLRLNESEGGALIFGDEQAIALTGYSYILELADMDADGKLDIILQSTGYQFLKNTTENGIPSFAAPQTIFTFNSNGFAHADLDRDGRPDMIALTGNNVNVMRNTSTPDTVRFSEREQFAGGTPNTLTYVRTADIDGDGWIDVIVNSTDGKMVGILRNLSVPGNISLAPAFTLALDAKPYGVIVGDLDGNNRPEITVLYNEIAKYSIFWNGGDSGTLAFSPKEDFDSRIYNHRGDLADFNGDDKPDLIFYNYNSDFLINQNNTQNENLSFASEVAIPASTVGVMRIADMDMNGKPDIIASSSSKVRIFRNIINEPLISSFDPMIGGPGTIVTITGVNLETTSSVSFGSVVAESFTVASATEIQAVVGDGASGVVSVTTSDGIAGLDGFRFANGPMITSFSPSTAVVGQEVTITGVNFKTELTENSVRFGTTLAEVTSATEDQLVVIVPGGAAYQPISVTTGDGTGYSQQSFLPSFNGSSDLPMSFTHLADFDAGDFTRGLALGDMDDDGKTDVVVSSAAGNNISVLLNTSADGVLTLAAKQDFATGGTPEGIVVADVNNDGKLDVIAANSADNSISVLQNESTPGAVGFKNKIDFLTLVNPQTLAAADFNLDGKVDIVACNYVSDGLISVLRNFSTPTEVVFSFAASVVAGEFPTALAIADFNTDDLPDIAVVSHNSLYVLINMSTEDMITFNSRLVTSNNGFAPSVLTSDMDGNGTSDIIVVNDNSGIASIYYQDPAVPLSFSAGYPFGDLPSETPGLSALGDMNGDGLPDLVLAFSNNKVAVTVKHFTFTPTATFATTMEPYAVALADMDGDHKTDVVTVNDTDGSVSIVRNTSVSINSISPLTASRGETVTISGDNLDAVTGVMFGDINAVSFEKVSSTTITGVVGEANSGNVTLVLDGTVIHHPGFEYVPTPEIASFTPVSGSEGDFITLAGFDFIDVTSVSFGETPAASFTVDSRNHISAVLAGGSSGDVSVVTSHGTAVMPGFTHNDDVVGVEAAISAERECVVFPNPTAGKDVSFTLHPSVVGETAHIALKDVAGRSTLNTRISAKPVNVISTEGLVPGLYMMEIKIQNRTIVRKLMLK